ncbi:hypothetical protein LN650_14385 [Klebsiella pneumoniae subsp. pneumoniae]|nr:hypothetical protein [Klebsiella pneumoniae subsp. pneumoniae]
MVYYAYKDLVKIRIPAYGQRNVPPARCASGGS